MKIEIPVQVAHEYTQRLNAPPEAVFPLLCPVREAEWAKGWDPRVVYSHSGVAEPGGIFITADHGREAVWVISRHEPETLRVEFIKTTPGFTVCHITIALRAEGAAKTLAEIRYHYTALSPEGRSFVEGYTPAAYVAFMEEWQGELNAFLARSPKP